MLRGLVRFMVNDLIEGLIPEKGVRALNAVSRVLLGIGLFLFLLGFVGAIRLAEEGLGDFGIAVCFIGFIFIMVGMRLRFRRFVP